MYKKCKREILTDEVVRAILKRKNEVNKTVIIVRKLMEAYEMSEYIRTAEKLILAKEVTDEFMEEHFTLDFVTGNIWLDIVGLHYYRDILTGFIGEDEFQSFMKYVESLETTRALHNTNIKMYRNKSIRKLFHTMHEHKRFKKSMPEQTKLINTMCWLELISRTPFPWIYYFLKVLPMRLKVNYIGNRITKNMLADLKQ